MCIGETDLKRFVQHPAVSLTIVDDMKNLIAFVHSADLKHLKTILIYDISSADCLHLEEESHGFWVFSLNALDPTKICVFFWSTLWHVRTSTPPS